MTDEDPISERLKNISKQMKEAEKAFKRAALTAGSTASAIRKVEISPHFSPPAPPPPTTISASTGSVTMRFPGVPTVDKVQALEERIENLEALVVKLYEERKRDRERGTDG